MKRIELNFHWGVERIEPTESRGHGIHELVVPKLFDKKEEADQALLERAKGVTGCRTQELIVEITANLRSFELDKGTKYKFGSDFFNRQHGVDDGFHGARNDFEEFDKE